jgi:hypothetical protein
MSNRSPAPAVAKARGRVGSLTRSRTDQDPDLVDARRDLAAANIGEYVRKVVSNAPPLTAEQQDRIAALLGGGGSK